MSVYQAFGQHSDVKSTMLYVPVNLYLVFEIVMRLYLNLNYKIPKCSMVHSIRRVATFNM